MESVLIKSDIDLAKKNMEAFFKTHDVQYVTQDAVFINMGSGQKTEGREAIGKMLHYLYHVAFDAQLIFTNSIITEDKAMVEGFFKGIHIGEFAGIPASNKRVDVPLCVTYDLEHGLIKKASFYMLGDVMIKQLTSL